METPATIPPRALALCRFPLTIPTRSLLIFLILGAAYSSPLALNAQTIFQDAQNLNTLRDHYEAYCRAIANQDNVFSRFRQDLLSGKNLPVPKTDGPLREEIKTILGADANTWDVPGTNPNAPTNQKDKNAAPAATGGPALEAQIQKVAQEWALIEEYLQQTSDSLHLKSATLDTLSPMAGGFTYLDDITDRAGGQASTKAAVTPGTFSSLLGMNEADVIMGIVEWTIQQAKQELMKAFLSEWMDRIKADSALILLFPNTLNMLETTDITTIFSNGDVWKAAFKQDLDAMPAKILPVVSCLIRNLPPRTLTPAQAREILGATRIATDVYQSIGNGNTVEDALHTLTAKTMLLPDTSLSVLEKGVILSSALLEAITVVEGDRITFVTPGTIAGLDSTELMDLWNLMFITLQPKLDKVFEGTQVDSFYHRVAGELPLFQYALMQVADIIQTIKQLTDPGMLQSPPATNLSSSTNPPSPAKKLDFQETDRYFQLSLQLLDESVDLLDSLHILPAKDALYWRSTVRPLAVDVMNGVEGAATQQYGMVITSLIDIVERLDIRGGNVAAAVAEAATLIARLKRDAQGISGSSDVNGDLNRLAQGMLTFRTKHGQSLAINPATKDFKDLLDRTIAQLVSNNLGTLGTSAAAQKFVQNLVADLEKELQQAMKDLEGELGSTALGHAINTYGRFVVNVLTAQSSEDIETILNDFAMGSGGYMVKQTSQSAFTVTFLPGVTGGAELLQFPDTSGGTGTRPGIGAYGGATLPIGIEYSIGIPDCKLIGAIGFYGQAADLGALLNYRLTNTDSVPVTPQIGFQQVLSPGAAFLIHFKNVPLTFGAGLAWSPALRSVTRAGLPGMDAHSLRLGASITVDVTVLQLWASKRKLNAGILPLGQVNTKVSSGR